MALSPLKPHPQLLEDFKNQLPLLLIGLPGVPGFNAFFYLRTLFPGQVVGIVPPNAPELMSYNNPSQSTLVALDPEFPDHVEKLFQQFQFKTVIDASGWCALKPCELDPALGRRLNVDVGVNIMRAAKQAGCRLIRLSTDLVFDGCERERDGKIILGDYREDEKVSPVSMYGKLMAESESLILSQYPSTAILRIALPMGPSMRGYAGAIDWIESRFRKDRPATLYFDEVRSNLYVQDLNRILVAMMQNEAHGIYHVGGPLNLTLYQIAQVVNRVGNYPEKLLMGCLREAAGPMPPRAGNVTMDTSKLKNLFGPKPLRAWPFDPSQVPTQLDWHRDRPQNFPAQAIADTLFGIDKENSWDHPSNLIRQF